MTTPVQTPAKSSNFQINQQLLSSIIEGDQNSTELLINQNADLNRFNENFTPLHIAVDMSNKEIVQLLLNNNADPNPTKKNLKKNQQPAPPLTIAVRSNDAEIAKLLLDFNADPNTVSRNRITSGKVRWSRKTHLEIALEKANFAMLKLLLEKGANINSRNDEGETLLFKAIAERNEPLIKFFIDNKIDVNIRNNKGETAIFKAVTEKNKSIIKLLLDNKADLNIRNNKGGTLLFSAIAKKSESMVKFLLDNKLDPNITTNFTSKFASETRGGISPLWIAVCENLDQIVRILLEHGAKPDKIPGKEDHVLKICLDRGDINMARLLLESGALGWPFFSDNVSNSCQNYNKLDSTVHYMINSNETQNLFWKQIKKIFISSKIICHFIGKEQFETAHKLIFYGRDSSEIYESCNSQIEAATHNDSHCTHVFLEAIFRRDINQIKEVIADQKFNIRFSSYISGCSIFQLLDFINDGEIRNILSEKIRKQLKERPDGSSNQDFISAVMKLLSIIRIFPSTIIEIKHIENLLEHGADPNILHRNHEKPALFFAAQKSDEGLCHLLIRYGANVELAIKDIKNLKQSEKMRGFLQKLSFTKVKNATD